LHGVMFKIHRHQHVAAMIITCCRPGLPVTKLSSTDVA
jgi:hypothetical protein